MKKKKSFFKKLFKKFKKFINKIKKWFRNLFNLKATKKEKVKKVDASVYRKDDDTEFESIFSGPIDNTNTETVDVTYTDVEETVDDIIDEIVEEDVKPSTNIKMKRIRVPGSKQQEELSDEEKTDVIVDSNTEYVNLGFNQKTFTANVSYVDKSVKKSKQERVFTVISSDINSPVPYKEGNEYTDRDREMMIEYSKFLLDKKLDITIDDIRKDEVGLLPYVKLEEVDSIKPSLSKENTDMLKLRIRRSWWMNIR